MTIKHKSIKKTCNLNRNPPLHGSFADIDWANGPYFLKTDIDLNGSNDYSITSVQQLLSVPYALYAKDAGNGFSGDYNDLVNVPQIPQIPADISAFNNDAHYVTNTNNNCADSLDFCALLSLMAQLQQQLDDIQNQLNQIPTVQTIDVYGIRYHECESGGIVVDDGGAAITSLGLC